MSDDALPEGWTPVTETLPAGELARAVALLTAEEIEHRVAHAVIEVPADMEADAVAVLAALDDQPDPGPDQIAEFAACTTRVNDEPMSGFEAQTTAMALNMAGIRATSDAPGGIGGSEVHMMAQCYVLVEPEDRDRARVVLEGLSVSDREAALRRVASELVAGAVPPDIANAIRETLDHERIAVALLANPDDAERLDVFVQPADGARAQAVVAGIAHAAASMVAEAADDADPPADLPPDSPGESSPQSNTQASILLFAALAIIAVFVMKSCK